MTLLQFAKALIHALEEHPSTVINYIFKRLRLSILRITGFWASLAKRSKTDWNDVRASRWLQEYQAGKLLISPDNYKDFIAWVNQNPEWFTAVQRQVNEAHQGKFNVFDKLYEFNLNDIPWQKDWRYDFVWPNQYYLNYKYYVQNKTIPYDVKYPWELSRMGFILPLAQMAALTQDTSFIEFIIDDWEKKNPLGYSINWEPMTCAIHGISLSLSVQMVAGIPNISPSVLSNFLRQTALQGEFLFRNIEDSIVHHNHYASIIAGLLVMGFTLRGIYPPANAWFRYAEARISNEILEQFCDDGVNFEKSISYHRLVTEFFLIGLIVLDKAGVAVDRTVRERIERACTYTYSYIRADDQAPNFGDNDGAWLLALDPKKLRDHSSLVSLAAAYFNNSAIKRTISSPTSSIVWLLGRDSVQSFNSMSADIERDQTKFFKAGGMFISRAANNSLIADFGEVGKHGDGGHGHNDTFSFELVLDGKPIFEDAGSPTYTGSIQTMMNYASTSFHNTLRVDGEEMAIMPGFWRITDQAHPYNVSATIGDEIDEIRGEHAGYSRLVDPVRHQRILTFQKLVGRLVCRDTIYCQYSHLIERFFWFSSECTPELKHDCVIVKFSDDKKVRVQWNKGSSSLLEPVQMSKVFGSLSSTYRLVLSDKINGETDLYFEVLQEQEGI